MCHESKVKHFSGAHHYSAFHWLFSADLFFNTQEQSVMQDTIRLKDSSTLFYCTFKTANTILESESSWVIQYHNQRCASRNALNTVKTNHSFKWNTERKRDVTKNTETRWCYRRWRKHSCRTMSVFTIVHYWISHYSFWLAFFMHFV